MKRIEHKQEFKCHTRIVWLSLLPKWTFHGPTLTGHVLHQYQRFKVVVLESLKGAKKYDIEVSFNNMNALLNFVKIYQVV
jgi:hypothetical protein